MSDDVRTGGERTGGCQCGAVRFRIQGKLGRPSICHCRMCQKAFGGFFGPLITAPENGLTWSRGEPAWFQSSINIARGFCASCGTPLAYRHPGGLEIAIGAFDDRTDLAPQIQVNVEARIPWVTTIFDQPVHSDPDYYAQQESVISFQHPDHDTADWPSHGLSL
ncbi:GFA family protein [Rhizobium sp. 9140]|uniref:GFA family protein n=1 Tax=Rhizobium sp. 9140 TaxID=1761900 RepID=UPI0007938723|nr:GFA family protein [Rhizobium sp. 9140]CZT34710.1 Uncharacterized conserved protein [Rhizobium sp. 9140]